MNIWKALWPALYRIWRIMPPSQREHLRADMRQAAERVAAGK